MHNLYQILGVNKNVPTYAIKKAYRDKALYEHPDKGGSAQKMALLTTAYQTLSDPIERKKFDQEWEIFNSSHDTEISLTPSGYLPTAGTPFSRSFRQQHAQLVGQYQQKPLNRNQSSSYLKAFHSDLMSNVADDLFSFIKTKEDLGTKLNIGSLTPEKAAEYFIKFLRGDYFGNSLKDLSKAFYQKIKQLETLGQQADYEFQLYHGIYEILLVAAKEKTPTVKILFSLHKITQEIQNFPLGQKDDQCALKNKEDEYNTESDISCAESVLQTDETYSDSTDWSSEEDSSCSSDYLLPEDSFLMKLEIPLTESEKSLIDEFYQKMAEVEAQNDQERKENIHNLNINCTENALKRIKCLVDEYLKRGIRLNSSYNDSTVTYLIFEKIKGVLDDVVAVRPTTHRVHEGCDLTENYEEEEILKGNSLEIIKSVISNLLLKGGKVKRSFFYYDRLTHVTYDIDYDLFEKCRKIDSKLKNVAYNSVINKNKDDFKVAIDNGYFFIKYEKSNVVEMTKVTNNQLIDDLNSKYKLNLKIGILQIGESIVRVEKLEEQRNYTDVPQGKIKMSFTIEGKAEKISILLYPDKEDSSKIKVELDKENQKKFDKLKDKSSLGKNCLLGGKNVLQAIQDKEFTKHESYKPTTSAIIPTFLEQASISNVFSSLKDQCAQFQKYLFGG
ncbi:J domain-containing protein [Candidatus Mesenet endosymbiont of Agriotes lineatus]|uniref:J domain-containing protein n=1 Tax=Candidatus Mesenet endosymbiont of Agriotes lineatus TaxID=3077948 RepID=UPI0030D3BED7